MEELRRQEAQRLIAMQAKGSSNTDNDLEAAARVYRQIVNQPELPAVIAAIQQTAQIKAAAGKLRQGGLAYLAEVTSSHEDNDFISEMQKLGFSVDPETGDLVKG